MKKWIKVLVVVVALFGALVVLPALVLTLRPKYFEPSGSPSPDDR